MRCAAPRARGRSLLALLALLSCAQLFAESSPSSWNKGAFSLDPVLDGVLLGFGAAFSASAYVVQKVAHFPEYDECHYDLDSVNWLDRKLSQSYSKGLDHWGTATCAVNLALPFAVYGVRWACGEFSREDYLTMSAMFAECYLLDYGAKNFLKMAIQRKRPYMYYEGYPEDELDDYDFEFSSPSGHTTDSFLGAGFLTYTFCRWYPASSWKVPVIAASYSVAVTTAVLRVASGKHFVTDTLFGAALGSAIGFGVPLLHEWVASRTGRRQETSRRAGDAQLNATASGLSLTLWL